MTIERINGQYVINRNDGSEVALTCSEVSLLINFCGKEGLREQIKDRVESAQNFDELDMDRYEGTFDEFIDEIYTFFEEEIDYGNSVDDDHIDDKISDLGHFYGLYTE